MPQTKLVVMPMRKVNKIFIPCEEANHNCDKFQYDEATFWEKIKLNIHLLYCKFCREYSRNNSRLSKLMKNKEVEVMPAAEKNSLKKAFEKELRNHE